MRRLALLGLLVLCSACATPARPATGVQVVATTSLLAALAQPVAGDRAAVSSIVPVGASPETYEPAPADVARLSAAKVILVNGAGLETWFARTLAAAKAPDARVVTLSDGLPVVAGNPHLWLDPQFARTYVGRIRDALAAADPDGAGGYRERAAAFDAQLVALQSRIVKRLAALPPDRRKMIVYHAAWLYFDRRFGIDLLGAIVEAPGREPSPDHLARLVDAAKGAHLHAIFAEPEYDPRLVRALAQSAGIRDVIVLYDDSVGTSPQTRDFITMLDYDTDEIVRGLR